MLLKTQAPQGGSKKRLLHVEQSNLVMALPRQLYFLHPSFSYRRPLSLVRPAPSKAVLCLRHLAAATWDSGLEWLPRQRMIAGWCGCGECIKLMFSGILPEKER